MTLTYGSVCSGIEAATVAWHPLGWTPKFFAEIEKFPSAVLAHHYGSNMPGEPLAENGVPNYGDFTKIGPGAGPVDLLVGGTPCQSFSVAGKRLGLDDPRGNLALEFLALARRLRARWIVWENVPGVLSSYSDAPESEGGPRCPLSERQAGDEWDETRDFATFCQFVLECGYGFAYRVFDAQYVRVASFPRAVPQRRRRVFLVGYLGDWRPPAAVLFDPEGMRGDPPPGRKAGQGTAPTIASRPTGGGGLGTDFDLDGGLIANSGDAAYCVSVNGQRSNDYETETLVAHTLLAKENDSHDATLESYVAHALRGEGFDASEDGTGRGTPIVPVAGAICKESFSGGPSGRPEGAAAGHFIPFNSREDPDSYEGHAGALSSGSPQAQAVAWSIMPQNSGKDYKARQVEVSQPVMGGGPVGGNQGGDYIQTGWQVRRLTPKECERLQGDVDDYTRIPWRGKPAEQCPDGPRYKALGNSKAINVVRYIGERIDLFEKLVEAGEIPKPSMQEAAA